METLWTVATVWLVNVMVTLSTVTRVVMTVDAIAIPEELWVDSVTGKYCCEYCMKLLVLEK